MPGGFPWLHVRTWTNGVAPWIIAAAAIVGLTASVQRRRRPTAALVSAVPALWTGALLTACVFYPQSARQFAPAGLAVWGAFAAAWWFLSPTVERFARSHVPVCCVAALLGASYAGGVRGDAPSTRPRNDVLPDFTHIPGGDAKIDSLQRGHRVHLNPGAGMVTFEADPVSIEVEPLLTFASRSPDRCWTLLATPKDREGPPRQFIGRRSIDDVALLRYLDDGTHVLRVRSRNAGNDCELEAFSSYPRDVYSHLNTCCAIRIRGHHDLRIVFGPCPDEWIDVQQFDYPFGRPARFAYLGADGMFVIVEASSGEKGPFRTIAEGPLSRDEALTITVLDERRRLAVLTFDDWASQASTELSPTAGWGVPQNAIEFQRLGVGNDATVALWMTLAGTSVGRGFDSVGHKAGTYRNRIRIEAIGP